MNAAAQFKDFVSRQQRPATVDSTMDWQKERDDWLKYLSDLYDQIDAYLADYIRNGSIEIHDALIELTEENIGLYQVSRRIISIGSQDVVFTPVGTLLIGTKGRVDVEGSSGRSRLLLVDQNATDARSMIRVDVRFVEEGETSETPEATADIREVKWTWKIVTAPPSMQFIDLNQDTLFAMLMEVSHA